MTTASSLVLARITSQVVGLQSTGIAANLAAIKKGTVKFPAVFVVPKNRRGSANRYMTGLVAQKREVRFQVVSAVRNISGAQGGKGITDIEQLTDLVDGALFGHSLSTEHDPLIFESGAMAEMQNGEV
ncbi:MAG: hypothetical protein C0406_09370, partial [Sideroxydans sp.]|nr:hypothetical protein [Sideroxydans sp.]